MTNLTVKELKELAKEAGIKGYYNMRKAELIEALNNNAEEKEAEVVNMYEEVMNPYNNERSNEPTFAEKKEAVGGLKYNNKNKGEGKMKSISEMTRSQLLKMAKEKGIKGAMKMQDRDIIAKLESIVYGAEIKQVGSLTDKQMDLIVRHRAPKEILEFMTRRSSKMSKKMIKKHSKKNKTVAYYQIVAKAVVDEKLQNPVPVLKFDVNVGIGLESNIMRAVSKSKRKIADDSMFLEMTTTHEVVMLKLDKSLYSSQGNPNIKKEELKDVRVRLFNILKSENPQDCIKLIINNNGLAHVSLKDEIGVRSEEKAVHIKFLGISPSGLRTKTMMLAAVAQQTSKNIIQIDRRDEILNKSLDGAFVRTFKDADGAFKDLGSKDAQFKGLGRMSLGAPGSVVMSEISTMVCFDNVAAGCEMTLLNGETTSASDTKDGNSVGDVSIAHQAAVRDGVPVRPQDFMGVIDQGRGAGRKDSLQYMDHVDMVTYARHLLSENAGATVSYVIVNGVRFSSEFNKVEQDGKTKKVLVKSAWEKVVEAGLEEEFYKSLQLVTDENAMKLTTHNDKYNAVKLKMAYKSDMFLSKVSAMSCILADPDNAPTMLLNKALKGIVDKFNDLGVEFKLNEQNIVSSLSLDFDNNRLNNEEQFMTYLRKCDFKKTVQLFPAAVRSEFSNAIQGIAKMITEGTIPLEKSSYSVVQADPAVIFNRQILAENEIIGAFLTERKVAITRHPISSLTAVTTLNVVSQEEVIERILKLDVTPFVKRYLINAMVNVHECVIIPASHFLMEKHDGMDFDIDAVQVIEDQDIVECLSKLPNIGSVIKSSERAKADRMIMTSAEKAIKEFKYKPKKGLVRPSKIVDAVNSKPEQSTASPLVDKNIMEPVKEEQKAKERYDLSYTSSVKVVQDFFETEIASVGQIANAFYNNALILLTLKSKFTPERTRNTIVKAFQKYYKCNGKKQYVSTIDRTVNNGKWSKGYDVEKFDCTEAVFRFSESNGSLHSLIAYLEDCCDYNRYLAETSIDAAKNNYYISNMFRHTEIVAALGADSNCAAVQVESNDTFGSLAVDFGMSADNYFKLKLIQLQRSTGLEESDYIACNGEVEVLDRATGKLEVKQACLAIEDPLYVIKKQMKDLTNTLIVLAAKAMEVEVQSPDAIKAREDIRVAASLVLEGSTPAKLIDGEEGKASNAIHSKTAPAIDSIKKAYATATLALKKAEEGVSKEEKSDEIKGVSRVEYAKKIAVSGIKNFVKHAFSDFTDVELGALICSHLVSTVTTEKCGTINAALYKVCEEQMIKFLAKAGFENVGLVGEEIAYVENNNKLSKVSNYVGQAAMVVDGVAELADGSTIVMDNKKANINGVIVEANNRFFVQANKTFDALRPEDGIIYNVNRGKYSKLNNIDVASIEYKGVYGKLRSVIVATDLQGKEHVVASVSGRGESNTLLKNMDLSEMEIFSFVNKEKHLCEIVHISGDAYVAALNNINTAEEFVGNEFFAPAEPTGDESFNAFGAPEAFAGFESFEAPEAPTTAGSEDDLFSGFECFNPGVPV